MKKIQLAILSVFVLLIAAVNINCGGGGSSDSQTQGGIPPGPSEALWVKLPAGLDGLDVVTVADGVIVSGNDNIGKVFVAKYGYDGAQKWLVRFTDGTNPTSTFKNGLAVNGENVVVATNEPVNYYGFSSNTGRVYVFSSSDGSVLSHFYYGDRTIKAVACDNGYVYTVSINPTVGLYSNHLIQRMGDPTFSMSAVDCVVKTVRGAAVKDGFLYIFGDAYTNRFMYAEPLNNTGEGSVEYFFFNGTSARTSAFDSNWIYVLAAWNGKYVVMTYPRITAGQPQIPSPVQLPVAGTPLGIAVYDNVTVVLCGDAPQSEVLMNGVTYRVYSGSGVTFSSDKQYLFLVNGNGVYRFYAKTGNSAR